MASLEGVLLVGIPDCRWGGGGGGGERREGREGPVI